MRDRTYFYSICTSMACSNLMVGVVPDQSNGHREVRLCQCIMSINTRIFFPLPLHLHLHIRLVRTPCTSTKPYYIMFPPEHDRRGSWTSILWYHNIKTNLEEMYWSTLLWRRVMYYPIISIPASYRTSPIGCTTIVHSSKDKLGHKLSALTYCAGSPTLVECVALWTTTLVQK